jgi:hypothetical protein
MILEELARKVKPMTLGGRGKSVRVKKKAIKAFEKLQINEFLDQNNEVFDFDQDFIPDLAW